MKKTIPYHESQKEKARKMRRESVEIRNVLVKVVERNFIIERLLTMKYHSSEKRDCVQIAILKHSKNIRMGLYMT